MAVRQKSASRKAPTLKSAPYILRLLDFRTIALHCERFCAPEDAPKGRLESEGRVQIEVSAIEERDGKSFQSVIVTLTVKTVGVRAQLNNREKVDSDRSFVIDLRAEGMFSVKGGTIGSKDDISADRMKEMIAQCYPLAISRVRDAVNDLGFRNARPTLGVASDFVPVVTAMAAP